MRSILRVTGAAVSILETFHRLDEDETANQQAPVDGGDGSDREVRGLARMVQVSPTVTLVDLTVQGLTAGTYRATIREYGDLEHGVSSTGAVWSGSSPEGSRRGVLGVLKVGPDGRGSAFLDQSFQFWEVIGHAMVVSRQDGSSGATMQNDEDTVVGIIARSAGMWDNDKTVCSCTGKTLWEERKDEVKRGML